MPAMRRLTEDLTVGIMSSWNCPVVSTFTKELLPAFCSPMSDSSISLRKNKLQQRYQVYVTRIVPANHRSSTLSRHPMPVLVGASHLRSQSRIDCHQLPIACISLICWQARRLGRGRPGCLRDLQPEVQLSHNACLQCANLQLRVIW